MNRGSAITSPGCAAPSTTLAAVAFVVAGVTLYAVMDGTGVFLSDTQSVVQIVWARYAFALPVVLAVLARDGGGARLRTRRPFTQAAIGLFPVLASFSVAGGFGLLSLPELTALTFAAPLLVVALSVPLLRERTTRHDWIGVLVGFLGILVVVRPGADALAWAAVFPLGCAFFFALYQVAMRFVGRHDDPVATLAWSIGTGLVVTTPLVLLDWRPPSGAAWAAMILTGLVFGAAQYCLIQGFRRAPPARLTPFTYTQIIPATLIGIVLFGSWPDIWVILGAALVIGAGIYVLRNRTRTG
ncbi:DMT family transporter [Geminicoccus roseus]|uniref:DMT family transporter n=1 Tax=Geminicoccus roseus TaxID=404900 RepID=UPI00042737C3|nr:DMT family transporter [Geminicoccus roseus]